jgi:oxepin-CoA hydrolase/3-oxo-5,6-dehydrosuberyl-CoA semialdehyde dehydrogenase
LLDHVGGQDVLAFTGSSVTGQVLRGGKGVLANSVRVNVEADSLNAAVLGPDVTEEGSSDVLNLFLADVVRDVTQKTGQKCTAIRRVYVPRAKLDAVVEHLRERLAAVKVGDPAREETGMGPLATAQQLKDVRDGVKKLETCARIVLGKSNDEGAFAKGFFLAPVLLVGDSPSAGDAVHSHEVFGPVVTVMPYDGTAESAASLVRAGGGGLVASVYSDDKDFVQGCVLGIAPFHGRVTIGSSKIASQAVPPGLVLPTLVHGGPGRAGGGEELGGRRGLAFYMQRTALQGDRALLEAMTGKR